MVLDHLGTGGLGELYRARDTTSGRTVALRLLAGALTSDADSGARLLAGLEAAAGLSHPNIATSYEVGEHRGQRFFALEFVPGESLTRLAGGRAMNPRRAIGCAIQIADALAEAHACGVEHGHLSAANVMITPKGHAKILDFGTAAWTRAGAVRGRRSDLVALGTLLSELLHGTTLVGGPILDAPGPLAGPLAEASAVAEALTSGGGVFESAATVAAALRSIDERLAAISPAVAPSPATRVTRTSSRTPPMWLFALAGLIGVAALLWAAARR